MAKVKTLYPEVRNQLAYISTKLKNAVDEYYEGGTNSRMIISDSEAERLDNLQYDAERLAMCGVAQTDEDWKVVEKALSLAKYYRLIKSK